MDKKDEYEQIKDEITTISKKLSETLEEKSRDNERKTYKFQEQLNEHQGPGDFRELHERLHELTRGGKKVASKLSKTKSLLEALIVN